MQHLITFNRWWDTGKVPEVYLKPFKRGLFYTLKEFINTRQILLIYGLRRAGKTILMYQLIDHLLKNGINKKHILYFSFDEKISFLKELFEAYSQLVLGKDFLEVKRVFVFLDEVQKLPDWQSQLKLFYDLYPNVKFIVSGSASLAISKGAKESLAGRIYEFLLPLLSFKEYLNFLGQEFPEVKSPFALSTLKEVYLKKETLLPLFFSYLKKGGFIEITEEEDDFKIKEYAKSILERIIFGDIPMSFKVKDPLILKEMIELIASNPGILLDYTKLSEIFKRDRRLIASYAFYLDYALLIKVFSNFSGSRFSSGRKLKKVYPASTNFIFRFCREKFFDSKFLGKVIENVVGIFLNTSFFWRERQKEVDFILEEGEERIPVEVKWKERIKRKDLNGILKFCEKFNAGKGIVLTKEELKEEKIKGRSIYFIPVWIYLGSVHGSV